MDGLKDFRRWQIGREIKNSGAPGTPVAASLLWRGATAVGMDDTAPVFPDENLGVFMDTTRNYIPSVGGSLKQGPDPCTYELLPYVLAAAIRGIEHGVKDGSGSGYIYDYPWPVNLSTLKRTANTIGFTSATKTIADSGNGLAFAKNGDLIKISGSVSNSGYFTVATGGVAGSIVVNEALTTESAGAVVTIELMTQVYTFEGGNNQAVEQSSYSFPTSFQLDGKGGKNADAITLSSAWKTRQWAPLIAGFTSLNPISVSEALFAKSRLYIDAVGGTMGTTEKQDTLASFSLKVNTGIDSQFAGNGNLYFSKAARKAKPGLTCDIQLYHNDAGVAEIAAFRAGTPRLLRIALEGPSLTTPGTLYSKKMIYLNLPGSWAKFPNLADLDGSDVLPGTFRPAYDAVAGIGPSITVVNELSALP